MTAVFEFNRTGNLGANPDANESNLEEAAHLDRLATLGVLAAGLSHELAQPLLAAQNFSSVAMSICHQNPGVDGKLLESVADVHAQVERAVRIVKRLQRFIARRTPASDAFDLNAAVREVLALLHHELLERKLAVKPNFMFALPLVFADNILVQQVIVNLLRNAMDADAESDLEAPEIEVKTLLDPPGHVRLVVSDQGPGLGAREIETIFTPFYSTKSSGLGLGLSLSRTIIETNGGRLWAENSPSGGAVFSFTLPLADGAT